MKLIGITDVKGNTIWINKEKIVWITESKATAGVTDILMEGGNKVFVSGSPTDLVMKYTGTT